MRPAARIWLGIAVVAVIAALVALRFAVHGTGSSTTPTQETAVARTNEPPVHTAQEPPAMPAPGAPGPMIDVRGDAFTALRNSGPATEPWSADAAALFAALRRDALTGAETGCYVAGCGALFTYTSKAAYEQARAKAEASSAYRAWTGGKQWIGAEATADGRLTVALVLYRPD